MKIQSRRTHGLGSHTDTINADRVTITMSDGFAWELHETKGPDGSSRLHVRTTDLGASQIAVLPGCANVIELEGVR